MKIIKHLNIILTVGAILFASSATAYSPTDVGEKCYPPKFKTFSPPEQIKGGPVPEVEPESEISFTVSGSADPTTITIVARDQPLKVNYVDRKSYYTVSAKLPASLNGKYVRLHLKVNAQKGFCRAKDGWLVKVKKAAAPEAEVTEQ